MKLYLLLPLLIFMLTGCQTDEPATSQPIATSGDLSCTHQNVILQTTPGTAGERMAILPKGSSLWSLGEVSPFFTSITRAEQKAEEPWLKVRTEDGQIGWVFAGDVLPTNGIDSAQWRQSNQMQAIFGTKLAARITAYQGAFATIQKQDDFVQVYKNSRQLRDSLVQVLEQKTIVQNGTSLPDLFWLEEVVPGYKMQLVAEGTFYYLFEDYKDWLPLALQTTEKADDQYLSLCLTTYSRDSIEYFYPAWFIQTWDYGGHSLLGRGIHQKVLVAMDKLTTNSNLFQAETEQLKKRLLQDVMQSEEGYWESPEAILAELDSIIAADYTILSTSDKIALETRRKMFEQATANDILTNRKSGGFTTDPEE